MSETQTNEPMTTRPPTTLERLERVEQELRDVTEKLASTVDQAAAANQLSELAAQRMISVEQALAALAKTAAALVQALDDKNILPQEEIMTLIRKGDDEGDREKVANMVKAKIIVKTNEVKEDSVVVVSQNHINTKDPLKSKCIREYCLVELPLPTIHPQMRKDLQGRKVGDNLPSGKSETGVYTMTVREIYSVIQPESGVRPGEDDVGAQMDNSSEPTGEGEAKEATGE